MKTYFQRKRNLLFMVISLIFEFKYWSDKWNTFFFEFEVFLENIKETMPATAAPRITMSYVFND